MSEQQSEEISQSLPKFGVALDCAYGVLLAIVCAAALQFIFKQAWTHELFAARVNGEVIVRSYVQEYGISRVALSADRTQIYDPAIQLKWTNEVISPLKVDKIIFSQYVPYHFTLMTPFATLPISVSFYAWVAVSAIVCFTGLCLLLKRRGYSWREQLGFCAGFSGSMPYLFSVYFGNLSPMLLGLLCLFVWAWRSKREVLAGVFLALATQKPQFAIFAAVPLIAHRRFKIVAAAAVGVLVLLIAASLNLGLENVVNYPAFLMKADDSSKFLGVFPEHMICLRAIFTAFDSLHAMRYSFLAMLLNLVGLFFLWLKTDSAREDLVSWAMSITVLSMLIFSPHCHIYDCVLLALPAALTLNSSSLIRGFSSTPMLFKCWSLLLLLYPVLSFAMYLGLLRVGYWSTYSALVFDVVLLVMAIMRWFALRRSQKAPAN